MYQIKLFSKDDNTGLNEYSTLIPYKTKNPEMSDGWSVDRDEHPTPWKRLVKYFKDNACVSKTLDFRASSLIIPTSR